MSHFLRYLATRSLSPSSGIRPASMPALAAPQHTIEETVLESAIEPPAEPIRTAPLIDMTSSVHTAPPTDTTSLVDMAPPANVTTKVRMAPPVKTLDRPLMPMPATDDVPQRPDDRASTPMSSDTERLATPPHMEFDRPGFARAPFLPEEWGEPSIPDQEEQANTAKPEKTSALVRDALRHQARRPLEPRRGARARDIETEAAPPTAAEQSKRGFDLQTALHPFGPHEPSRTISPPWRSQEEKQSAADTEAARSLAAPGDETKRGPAPSGRATLQPRTRRERYTSAMERDGGGEAAPDVYISIGRVEVRATVSESAPVREKPRTPHLALADYLKSRDRSGTT